MKILTYRLIVLWLLGYGALSIGQTPSGYIAPRTEYGLPDLQGNWEKRFATPVERPPELGEKRAYTEVEAIEFQRIQEILSLIHI